MEYCIIEALCFNIFLLYLFNLFKSEEFCEFDIFIFIVIGMDERFTLTVTLVDIDLLFFILERRLFVLSYNFEEILVFVRV